MFLFNNVFGVSGRFARNQSHSPPIPIRFAPTPESIRPNRIDHNLFLEWGIRNGKNGGLKVSPLIISITISTNLIGQ